MRGIEMHIRKVAVLGAGVMGAQIAAHLVNANVETLLFDLPRDGNPNGNVEFAIESLLKLDPSPVSSPARLRFIKAANYLEHLELLSECDLIIEAIAERMDLKADLYFRISPHLGSRAILASNTSGLSINQLAQTLPESLRSRFCGMHFFNPPRYMYLVELISCRETDAAILDMLETFLVSTLGKGVVIAKDTPGFIANRIGVFSMLATRHHAQLRHMGFDLVDALTGRYLGRPKSATFRTLDIVGLDVFSHVVNNMRENLTDDPWHRHFELPGWFSHLLEQGALGQKTKRGIYQKIGGEIHVLDLHTNEYRLSDAKVDEGVRSILNERDWAKKLAGLRANPHKQSQFLWAVFRDVFHYCALHLEHIADNARDVDFAVRWGFGWEKGPFEIWQEAGWHDVAEWIASDISGGLAMSDAPLPGWASDPQRRGVHDEEGSYSPAKKSRTPRSALPVYDRQMFPERLYGEPCRYGDTIFETDEVRMWRMEEDIAILSFKSKMHTVGIGVLDGMLRAVHEAEKDYSALIIWQTEPPFSYGANLLQLMQGVQPSEDGIFGRMKQAASRVKYAIAGGAGLGDLIDAATGNVPHVEAVVAKFQAVSQRLKYSQVPVIAAVDGLALGGGCEFPLHCARIVATLESYVGLVEVGVGLLPSGGGCKEMALRAFREAERFARDGRIEVFPYLRRYFQNIAMGEVSKSAEMAREMGYIRDADRIVMNRFELLHVAHQEARALNATDYRPPLHERRIAVAGRTGIATLKAAMINLKEGGFISDHDYEIGSRIAETLCGGDVDSGTMVDEQWLLDLERNNFMELLANFKTRDRIEYMLKNSKPLRN